MIVKITLLDLEDRGQGDLQMRERDFAVTRACGLVVVVEPFPK